MGKYFLCQSAKGYKDILEMSSMPDFKIRKLFSANNLLIHKVRYFLLKLILLNVLNMYKFDVRVFLEFVCIFSLLLCIPAPITSF